MGLPVGRIEKEFVLNNILDKRLPVKIHGKKEEVPGTLTSVTEEELTVQLENQLSAEVNTEVRVFFSYYGHIMTFQSTILRKDEEIAVLRTPKGIYKNLQRKYERVPCPPEVNISFTIKDTKVELNFPKTEEYNPADLVEYSLTFDPASMEQLINEFNQQAKAYAGESRIVMFRDREPELYEEELIIKTGKILYIPQTKGMIPEELPVFEGRVISKDFIHSLENKTEREELFSNLEKLLIRRNNEGVHSFLYCPLIYHEYVVGYVALLNRGENRNAIEPDMVQYTHQFARVLVYSLKINGYFKSGKPVTSTIEPKVIDICASGLLFSHSDNRLKELIMLYTDLTLTIKVGPRKMTVPSRVMRKFSDRHSNYFGIVFLNLQPEDFRFLFDYVYGRPPSPEDDAFWEGGTKPPKVNL